MCLYILKCVPVIGLGVVQRVGRGIAPLFHDHGTRRVWVVNSTPRPYFTPGQTRYPLYRRLGGPQGRSGRAENLDPPEFDPRTVQPLAQSLYRLSYPAHIFYNILTINKNQFRIQQALACHSLERKTCSVWVTTYKFLSTILGGQMVTVLKSTNLLSNREWDQDGRTPQNSGYKSPPRKVVHILKIHRRIFTHRK